MTHPHGNTGPMAASDSRRWSLGLGEKPENNLPMTESLIPTSNVSVDLDDDISTGLAWLASFICGQGYSARERWRCWRCHSPTVLLLSSVQLRRNSQPASMM